MVARARSRGIPNFHVFGEIYDPEPSILASFSRAAPPLAPLDFAFQAAVTDVLAKNQAPSRLARLFATDADFDGGAAGARRLPTFLGNHDMGRFAWFVKQANPAAGEDEIQRRVILGHAMMFFLRGQPVIYAGDEQGFVGTGGDQDSRQPLFASRVPEYLKTPLIGTTTGAGQDHFDPSHPIYRALAEMAAVRSAAPALRRGDQVIRAAGEAQGLFAVSRHDPDTGAETLIVFNTSRGPITAQVSVDDRSRTWRALHGTCASATAAPTSYPVSVSGLDYIICTSPGVP
jgi:glycosidase